MSSIASSRLYAGPRSRGWSIFLGILLVIAGLFSIAMPPFAGIAASLFFGWLIMFAGVAHLVYAWSQHGAGHILWQILIGVVYILAALYMLFFPVRGMAAIALVLAFYIAVEGVLEIAEFSALRPLPGAGWFLFDGIISLFLACMIFYHWPSSSFWAVGILVGVSLLFSGIARLTLPMHRPLIAAQI
jgi:uncharacterized membrane protein HdeD (DUF308 family)